jgi:molybdenum cofactor synthesis domain-containing protein
MNKTVKIEEAVGLVLAHDITEIRANEFKGRAFKKGHQIQEADICHLQKLGKNHIYVLNIEKGYLHEDAAAVTLADSLCGNGVHWSGKPKEGKLKLHAKKDGLLKVNIDALTQVNMLGEVMCASQHNNTIVKKGAVVAATRAIPLVVESSLVDKAVNIARSHGGIFQVKALKKAKTGVIITGNEVFTRLIEDQFEPIIRKKIDDIGSEIVGVSFAPDDPDVIKQEVEKLISSGADLILTTGGMSVDPDDVTRLGIQKAGGDVFFYGAPVLPGAMFMIAYIDETPVLGIPACGLYHKTTIFDLVLPRILAGEKFTRKDIAVMGHGGLCLNCTDCNYPICPFGK